MLYALRVSASHSRAHRLRLVQGPRVAESLVYRVIHTDHYCNVPAALASRHRTQCGPFALQVCRTPFVHVLNSCPTASFRDARPYIATTFLSSYNRVYYCWSSAAKRVCPDWILCCFAQQLQNNPGTLFSGVLSGARRRRVQRVHVGDALRGIGTTYMAETDKKNITIDNIVAAVFDDDFNIHIVYVYYTINCRKKNVSKIIWNVQMLI